MDRGAWWAAVHGVARSRTRLKRLSSLAAWRPTRPSRTNTQKRCLFHYRGVECKSRKSRNTWSNRQIWPWSTEWSRAKANRILPRESMYMLLLLLLSHFSHVRLCATPQMAAHQAPPSLGFFRQEYWSGLPFPSPMHESEKWKWSRWVMSDSSWPHGLQPTRLLHPWDFPGKSTGVGCHCLLQNKGEGTLYTK